MDKKQVELLEPTFPIDVFISYNSLDRDIVKELANFLEMRGLIVWYDKNLEPGSQWLEELEKNIRKSKTAAIFIGPNGLGQWQIKEKDVCLNLNTNRGMPVIPVLLPNAPDQDKFSEFLKIFTWVDLRNGFNNGFNKNGLHLLEKGIRGENGNVVPKISVSELENNFRSCMEVIVNNRCLLASLALDYYRQKKLINFCGPKDDDTRFPLIYKDNWLPEMPKDINAINIIWNETENNINPFSLEILPKTLSLPEYIKKLYRDEIDIYDNFAYKLDIIESNDPFTLHFSPSNYFNYIDTCEVLSYEFCWVLLKKYGKLFLERNFPTIDLSKIDFPLRNNIDVFDFSNRSSIAGINTLLIKLDKKEGDIFYFHDRNKKKLAEAMNTYHVVPAGTFQPATSMNNNHKLDFNFKRNILRELAEELLGKKELAEIIRSREDFAKDYKISKYESLMKDNSKTKTFFLGVGLDPLTTKPEILTCMVVDGAEMRKLSRYIDIKFTDNDEGEHQEVSFEIDDLNRYIDNKKTLPAGKACLMLAKKHYNFLKNLF